MSRASNIAYAIAFQIGWFVCIMAGNALVFMYTAIFIVAHFIFLNISLRKTLWLKEILWLLAIFMAGFILETVVFSAGFLYSTTPPVFLDNLIFPPAWLLSLWVLFAIALRTCLTFVFSAPKITYLIAVVVVPLNYYAGAQLNTDVNLNTPYILSSACISLLWVLLLWCLVNTKRYFFEDIFNAH
jgi:hypothetical protein